MKIKLWKIFLAVFLIIAMTGCLWSPLEPYRLLSDGKYGISKNLYITAAPTEQWKPYYELWNNYVYNEKTGEMVPVAFWDEITQDWVYVRERYWVFNPDEPWISNRNNTFAYSVLSDDTSFLFFVYNDLLSRYRNYAGGYVNVNGRPTVMLVNPTHEQASSICELFNYRAWIIAAEYPLSTLKKAREEIAAAIRAWMTQHPDVSVTTRGGWVDEVRNRVVMDLEGPDISQLIEAFHLPEYVEFSYQSTDNPVEAHDAPWEPNTVFYEDGIIVQSVREEYPVGVPFLILNIGHDNEGELFHISIQFITVEKYIDGRWIEVPGAFVFHQAFLESESDIVMNEKRTMHRRILAQETLGPGLYRATLHGYAYRSALESGTEDIHYDNLNFIQFEFVISHDAEPLPQGEGITR